MADIGNIRDTQCGFKLLDGEVARMLFADLLTKGFAFDVELLWLVVALDAAIGATVAAGAPGH